MRLVWHTFSEQRAHEFAKILGENKITSQLELRPVGDWGNEHYGEMESQIWILNEEDLDAALVMLRRFEENPNDPTLHPRKVVSNEEIELITPQQIQSPKFRKGKGVTIGVITTYILLVCTTLFLLGSFSANQYEPLISTLPVSPQRLPTLDKGLMYDYPLVYQLTDKLMQTYTPSQLETPSTLPPKGQEEFKQVFKTPFWRGFYPRIVQTFRTGQPLFPVQAPLFEQIREGQLWRLITPIFLHGGLLHILFNMMWLIVLGKQLEERLSPARYLGLIIFTAIFSNTAQYLMSGPDFIGFSGVVCGMLGYIWMRKRIAPQEKYELHPSTFNFILIFVLGMAALQLFLFFGEIYSGKLAAVGIANTAHISGGIAGLLFGRFFKSL